MSWKISLCAVLCLSANVAFAQTVSLAPANLSFSSQLVGTTSTAKSVVLTNTSKTTSLTITSIIGSGDYGESDNCISPIAPLGTCTVNITFSPNATGTLDGAVTITDNAANSPQTVNLTGSAIGPVAFSPASLSFPTTAVGTTSSPITLTVTNKQSVSLTVNGVAVSGDYAVSSSTCAGVISGGGTCTVGVTFTPSVAGTIAGALTLTDSAADSPEIVSLSGKASGTVTSTVTFTPPSLTFTTEQTGRTSPGKKVTLTNKGTSSLTINTVNASGDYSETDTCTGQTITVNGTCTITVAFTPSATGIIKGAITVTDAASTSPQTVGLTGTGAGALGFSPGTLTFGIQELGLGGSQSSTLTNYSASTVGITSIAVSGRYSQTNTCGSSVPAGESCTFTVTVAPVATGVLDGAVTVTDGASNSPQVLSVTSTGASTPRFAYVANSTGLLQYTVNPTTSQLRAVASLPLTTDGFVGVHPGNKFLYLPVGDGVTSPIHGYSINPITGALTELTGSPFATESGPSSLVFSSDGKFAYSGGAFDGAKEVESFSINAATGALTSLGTQPSGNPCGQALSPSGKLLYQTDYEATGTIYGYSVNSVTGALTPLAGSPFSGHPFNCGAFVHPSGKFLIVVDEATSSNNNAAPISVYAINATTSALTEVSGSPFAGGGLNFDDQILTDPTGKFLYIAVGPSVSGPPGVLLAYSINLTTGALTPVSGSPYHVGGYVGTLNMDPTGRFLYLGDLSGSGPMISIFSVNHATGALTQLSAEGVQGDSGYTMAVVSGIAPVVYAPKFTYVTNQTDKTISEYTINDATGALTAVAGSPLSDINGPQVVAASPNNKFVYTGNSNGSISEYRVSATTGALTKVAGSPIRGLGNPVSLVVDPTSSFLLVLDQNNKTLSSYSINVVTGALTFLNSATLTVVPNAVALNPLGTQALVASSELIYYPISSGGTLGGGTPYFTGYTATASSIDPSAQYLFEVDNADGGIDVYTLLLSGVQSGAPGYNTGNAPAAVVADPSGRFVYVANSADGTISAYNLSNSTGILTSITGTFTTGSGPDSLAVSNDGKYLYAANKSSGTVSILTINSDGTLTPAGSATTGTAPSSIVTTGTFQ